LESRSGYRSRIEVALGENSFIRGAYAEELSGRIRGGESLYNACSRKVKCLI
jgi:hypothetical protein